MPLRGVMAGSAVALLLAGGVAAALADPPPTTTTADTTATVPAATTAPPTPVTTTAVTTATAPTTTAPPTTTSLSTAKPTTTTPPAPRRTPVPTTKPKPKSTTTHRTTVHRTATPTPTQGLAPASACPIGGIVLLWPQRAPSVIGAVADARTRRVQLPSLLYPADGAIAKTSAITLGEHACAAGRPVSGTAQLREISLVGGSVRATSVTMTVGATRSAAVVGLAVDGTPSHAKRVPLQSWGYVLAGSQPPVRFADGSEAIAALSIHLLRAHAGLPAGTTILVGVVHLHALSAAATKAASTRHARATSHHRKKAARATHEPLTVTPPLGQRHFVFPVAGRAEYGDSYGGYRGDVPGNWHHGDDIFASLGTPVVAVADGTINRVGWEKLGGWRLWVRDGAGDEFYYAHLSGYAPSDLRSNRVRAGQVLGFIGNTGDAFTTAPHLHFEVHPRNLLHLGYDGAVDPTTYLDGWTHIEHVDAPPPTHPALPAQPELRKEARYVFRELLAARHLIRHAPKPSRRPHVAGPADANVHAIAAPAPIREAAPATVRRTGMSDLTFALLLGLVSFLLTAAILAVVPLRARLFRPSTPD